VSAYGSVQADPSARQAVMAPVAAIVGKIYVRLGQVVNKGAPLIQLLPAPQTGALYHRARAALKAANAQYRHTRELVAQYLATKQQLADAERAQSDARAALRALEAQGASGPKTIRAPFRVAVTKIDSSVGSLVGEGSALFELAPPDSLVLKVGVVPSDAAAIAPGDKAVVKAVGRDNVIYTAVLARGAVVDPSDGLVPIEIGLPKDAMLPGETAAASITTSAIKGFLVPHAAIQIDDHGRPYVVQVIGKAAKLILVRVLGANGGKDVVSGKLVLSAPLVVSGAHQLNDGMRVRLSKKKRQVP
jgi:RND family efflux transporter MFP subunit